jgi:hypothetical protein
MSDSVSGLRTFAIGSSPAHTSDAYDSLLAVSPQRSIYCNRWWLEAVAPGNWQILAIPKGGSELAAAWPLVSYRAGKSFYVQMPMLSQKLGILFAPTTAKYAENLSRQHTLIDQLIDKVPAFTSFTHSFHESFTNWLPFAWRGFEQTTRYTYLLDGIENHDTLWQEMRTTARTEIRKAVRSKLSVYDDIDLELFLALNNKTFERQGLEPPIAHETIRRVDQALLANAGRKILSAKDASGVIHAAVYIAWHRGTAYYLMAGADPTLRRSGAQYLLMWEAIRFSSTVADVFDFEGSMIPGVESAIRDLGGRQHMYFSITKNAARASTVTGALRLAGAARRRLGRFFRP